MRQLSLDFPEAARRACMAYQRAEPWTKDELERRVTKRPWRESKHLMMDEEVIESELLTTPGAVSEAEAPLDTPEFRESESAEWARELRGLRESDDRPEGRLRGRTGERSHAREAHRAAVTQDDAPCGGISWT